MGAARKALRPGDALIRYSETAFVAVLPATDRRTARALAERVSGSIEQLEVGVSQGRQTVQIGIGSSPEDGGTLQQLVEVARQTAVIVSVFKSPPSVH
ncbi:MAG TPA: diguanylate cyclase [Gemmatimonadaceae bacterium]|nr:diguanylate cyclase [Gemmatimonadaceae bacterium]